VRIASGIISWSKGKGWGKCKGKGKGKVPVLT